MSKEQVKEALKASKGIMDRIKALEKDMKHLQEDKIGVYHVEGVGLITGLAEAEKITQSFTGEPPVFVEWKYIGDEEQ
jgi:hypothetical protein